VPEQLASVEPFGGRKSRRAASGSNRDYVAWDDGDAEGEPGPGVGGGGCVSIVHSGR
jgi:hypothetical protein